MQVQLAGMAKKDQRTRQGATATREAAGDEASASRPAHWWNEGLETVRCASTKQASGSMLEYEAWAGNRASVGATGNLIKNGRLGRPISVAQMRLSTRTW